MGDSEMCRAALTLAARGWKVFPCIWTDGPKSKAPLTSHGFHDATTDPAQITSWWRRWPRALVAAPVDWRLVVLDIDPRHGGSLAAIERAAGVLLPDTPRCWSGRGDGGCHIFLQRPRGDLTGAGLPTGVDLREGGKHYTIVPPSLHPATGQPYRWEGSGQPAACPPGLAELLVIKRRVSRPLTAAPRGDTSRRVQGMLAKVAGAAEGSRSDILFWAGAQLANLGQLDQVADQLADAAAVAGLTPREIGATLRSARRSAR
jgi:hypothetical protein